MAIREYVYYPEVSACIVGALSTGKVVTIELWFEGQSVSIVSNECNEIGTTGLYSWSLNNIASISTNRTQYHWMMDDGEGDTVEGDFILKSYEGQDGAMPSLLDKDSYIIQN